jgi:hypothetical protein
VLGVGGVGCTEITERMGNTLSAVAGLSTSSARNVGEFGGMSMLVLSFESGSPDSERAGFSMRGVVVPGADPPSLNSVEANACPRSSSELRPAPLDRLLLSCSADITVHSSQSYSCRSCNNIESAPLKRKTRRGRVIRQDTRERNP